MNSVGDPSPGCGFSVLLVGPGALLCGGLRSSDVQPALEDLLSPHVSCQLGSWS